MSKQFVFNYVTLREKLCEKRLLCIIQLTRACLLGVEYLGIASQPRLSNFVNCWGYQQALLVNLREYRLIFLLNIGVGGFWSVQDRRLAHAGYLDSFVSDALQQ